MGSRGRGTILNGATRECFTEKATGVLSPGGGESAGTSAWVHRARVPQSERTAHVKCGVGELLLFLLWEGQEGANVDGATWSSMKRPEWPHAGLFFSGTGSLWKPLDSKKTSSDNSNNL